MKKIFVVLGLVVMMMFVVSCAPREEAIAGQAINIDSTKCMKNKNCNAILKDCVKKECSSLKTKMTAEGKSKSEIAGKITECSDLCYQRAYSCVDSDSYAGEVTKQALFTGTVSDVFGNKLVDSCYNGTALNEGICGNGQFLKKGIIPTPLVIDCKQFGDNYICSNKMSACVKSTQ